MTGIRAVRCPQMLAISRPPTVTGTQNQIATPPRVWNGWENRVKTVTVIAISANASENDEYSRMLRRSRW